MTVKDLTSNHSELEKFAYIGFTVGFFHHFLINLK